MGCVQSYFRRAHNSAGVSPSSTQESNSGQAALNEEAARHHHNPGSITEEPESNDTSHGVEATAVRTLAASTGTVAILGTTAKTKGDVSPGSVHTILIPEGDEGETSVEAADVHKEEEKDADSNGPASRETPVTSNSRPISSALEENDTGSKKDTESIDTTSPPSTSNTVKENQISESPSVVTNKSLASGSNKSEVASPEELKSSTEEKSEIRDEISIAEEPVVSETSKEKEEDLSKSISSERLKSNSISNTTLSSDSIVAEFENGSIKQSPSADKVVESFDSSSTVEFVDHVKDAAKGVQPDDKTNPARSISSDLSSKANLPVDGEKTPDVKSPEKEEQDDVNDLPPPPPPEALEAVITNELIEPVESIEKEVPTQTLINDLVQSEQDINTHGSYKDETNNELSVSEASSNISSDVQSVIRNESNVQEEHAKSVLANSSSNVSEENNKAETGSPLSSDNNSSFNDNVDAASPVTAVILSAAPKEPVWVQPENKKLEKTESIISEKSETTPVLTNGLSSSASLENKESIDKSLNVNGINAQNSLETIANHTSDSKMNGKGLDLDDSIDLKDKVAIDTVTTVKSDVNGKSDVCNLDSTELNDGKVVAAATAIQATFRGYQTRQNLKESGKSYGKEHNSELQTGETNLKKSFDEVEKTTVNSRSDSITELAESILDEVDDKIVSAVTTIQASFRGYQTRQTLKNKIDSGLPPSEEFNVSGEGRTPTVLTPELIESVKEEVDDICKEAEILATERAESADMFKGVQQVVVGMKESALQSVSSVKAVRGSVTPPSVSEALDTDDTREEVFDSLTETDDQMVNAATTIQATFRGFQTRKQMQNKTGEEPSESMADYPPPVAEDEYLQSLEDLPPPDFEALESSYSEDAPTEPLAPPPDPIVFNEEEEDELAALQRPAECDELPEHRPTATLESESSESSLSSAATKIQAGVRGYLTRKQIQEQGQGTAGTGGTTSTSTITSTILDSDQSLSVSREEEGIKSAISTEEESEVTRHLASPEGPRAKEEAKVARTRSAGKRMSLAEVPVKQQRAPLRTAMSVQVVSDDEVWTTLQDEMAATKIQSNFRGYRARKQLQREDAMQVTTSGSSQATPSSGSVDAGGRGSVASEASPREDRDKPARSSGEFHDIIALTPPNLQLNGGGAAAQSGTLEGQTTTADMVKRRADEDGDGQEAEAATKIQATFRGYKARRELSQEDRAAAKIQAGFRGYRVRKEMKTEQGGERVRANSVEAAAATKIQAGVRGFLVRRRNLKEEKAATKIQAGFRGYHTRKQLPADQ